MTDVSIISGKYDDDFAGDDSLRGQGTLVYVNEAGVSEGVMDAVKSRQDISNAIETWTRNLSGGGSGTTATKRPSYDLFKRDRYHSTDNIFRTIELCSASVENDDVLSGLCDVSEGIAIQKMKFEMYDEDQQDVWNQIARDLDMDSRLREIWRELFKASQVYIAVEWDYRTYTVRTKPDLEQKRSLLKGTKGPGRGNRNRKKEFRVFCPTGLSILDPVKVVPVGSMMFGRERFAYIADRGEGKGIQAAVAGEVVDNMVMRLIERKYEPSEVEKQQLGRLGIATDRLWLFRENAVFRHSMTRSQYERFSVPRLKSILPLIDMKQHLREADRAALVGNALRVDQRVATPQGWKPIGDAQVGDEVFGPDGRPTRITHAFPQGERPLYRVTFKDGAEVICDESHLWTVRAPKGDWRTITTQQMLDEGVTQPNGVGTTGKSQVRYRHEVPLQAPQELPEADLPLDSYLMGCLLGDGSMTQGTPYMSSGEDSNARPWMDVLPDDCEVTQYENGCETSFYIRRKQGTARRNAVKAALSGVGLWGCNSHMKFIPEDYLWGSVEQRFALLQGLADTDGSPRRNGNIHIPTVSEKMADGIVELAQSLGGYAFKRFYTRTGGTGYAEQSDIYIVDVAIPAHLGTPYRLKRKISEHGLRKRPLKRIVAAIEPVHAAEALCIKVEREDGLFLTEGRIVTHNTNFIVVIRKGTDKLPARSKELEALQEQARVIARVPVIIGDHRLSVDIVAPPMDNTLNATRYDTLDSRLVFRALGSFAPSSGSSGGSLGGSSSQVKEVSLVVSRGFENRRHQIGRSLERALFRVTVDANPELTETPSLVFSPRRISLDVNQDIVNAVLKLRDRGELSRGTALEELDYDQEVEAIRRVREEEEFDDIFLTHVPFDAPANSPGGPGGGKPATPGAPNDTEGGRPKGSRTTKRKGDA